MTTQEDRDADLIDAFATFLEAFLAANPAATLAEALAAAYAVDAALIAAFATFLETFLAANPDATPDEALAAAWAADAAFTAAYKK